MGIGEGIGGMVGGIFGGMAAGDERGHQQALIDEAIASINAVNAPQDLAQSLYFQNYQNAGQLTPAQEQAILAGPSAEGQVKANPELVKAQMQALSALKNITQTGMTSADRARLNQIQQQMATQEQGQRQAIMQNYAQRGLAGSGNELLAQLTNAQNAANQANQSGLNVAANAQQNALSALGQYGGMAGQMNQQQFGQNAQTAQAADLMNRFNIQNQLGQQQRNVQNQNVAGQFNLQNKQNIMNQNTGLYNQDRLLQRQGEEQMFQNAMQKANALSGAQRWGADQYGGLANQIAQSWTNTGKGIGGIADMSFGVPSSQNTMGTNTQSGGITQGSADALDQYIKQNRIGYAEGGVVNYHDGGYFTPNTPYAHGGVATGGADGLNGVGKDLLAMDVDPRQMIKGVREEKEHTSDPRIAKQIALDHLSENSQYYAQGGQTFLTPAMNHALMRHGGKVPGEPKVPGPVDSYENDTVHARLSPGEIVVPRSITESEHAGELAKKFIECELKKYGK